MRIAMTIIGVGAILAAAPAFAADNAASSTNAKPTAAGRVKERTYCVEYEAATGSRIGSTMCKTKSQWAKEGVNVDQLTKPGRT